MEGFVKICVKEEKNAKKNEKIKMSSKISENLNQENKFILLKNNHNWFVENDLKKKNTIRRNSFNENFINSNENEIKKQQKKRSQSICDLKLNDLIGFLEQYTEKV